MFPYPNSFVSEVYANHGEESAPGPGEITRDRVWDNGANPGYKAQCFLGEPEWFKTGQLPALTGPPPPMPACCAVIQTVTCAQCVGGKGPLTLRLAASGATGPRSPSNGIFFLTYLGFCQWQIQIDPVRTWTVTGLDTVWVALYEDGTDPDDFGEIGFTQAVGTWTCMTETDNWNLNSSNMGGTGPTLLQIG